MHEPSHRERVYLGLLGQVVQYDSDLAGALDDAVIGLLVEVEDASLRRMNGADRT